MKKVYASIAMAVATCGVAGAATATNALTSVKSTNAATEIEELTPVTVAQTKAAATAPQAEGMFVFNYVGRTSSDNTQQESGVQVVINGTDATITGIWNMAVVKGTYNPATGVLRVPNEQATLYKGDGGATINLYCQKLTVVDGKITAEPILPYIEFEYSEAGFTNTLGETMLVGGWYTHPYNQFNFNVPANMNGTSTSGYRWLYAMQWHSPAEYYKDATADDAAMNFKKFVYNENEWVKKGDAVLSDGWFKALDGYGYAPYTVECRVNVNNPNQILLVNPYGATSPYGTNIDPDTNTPINAAAKEQAGYILMDITDPKCVFVQPFINSGFNTKNCYAFTSSAGSGDRFYPTNGFFGCTNLEGWRYFIDKWPATDIIEEAETFGDPISTLNKETRVVDLPTCRLQRPSFDNTKEKPYIVATQWTYSQDMPIPMESKITLAEDVFSGVADVVVDENAPVQYFNLQGVEISNPEAGELVIVKQGSKVTKTVVK